MTNATKPMVDITDIQPKEKVFEILHPGTGEGLGILVTQVSQDNPNVKLVKRQLNDMMVSKRQRGQAITAAMLEHNEITLCIASITGWDWSNAKIVFHGEKPEFNKVNVKTVLTELSWFRAQCDQELADEQSFFR